MNACTSNKPDSGVSPEVEKESLAILKRVLNDESEWVKVHAAEFLIWSGHAEGVKDVFLKEEKLFGAKSQYRIGIWRVLAQTENDPAQKKIYTDKIMEAFLDTSGTDRIHAVETLAKLHISPLTVNESITRQALVSPLSLGLYARWSVAFSSEEWLARTQKEFLDMIVSGVKDAGAEKQGGYILRQFGRLPEPEWKKLVNAVLSKPAGGEPNVYLYSAAFATAPEDLVESAELEKVRQELLKFGESLSKGDRSELAIALSINGTEKDIPALLALLHNEKPLPAPADNADVSAAAGYALLKLGKRLDAATER